MLGSMSNDKSFKYVMIFTTDGEERVDHPDTFWITEAGVLVVETQIDRRYYAPGTWTRVEEILQTA